MALVGPRSEGLLPTVRPGLDPVRESRQLRPLRLVELADIEDAVGADAHAISLTLAPSPIDHRPQKGRTAAFRLTRIVAHGLSLIASEHPFICSELTLRFEAAKNCEARWPSA
jgi:hypothetical protein